MSTGASGHVRILIVPEDLLSYELTESFLDRQSLTARTAINADQALAIAKVWRPQLVVLRSRLGTTPVSLFCRSLKYAPDEQQTPKIIMLTDHVGHSLQDATEAGADAHLVSPVEQEQLLQTIAILLGIEQRKVPRAPLEALVHTEGFVNDGAVDSTLANAVTLSEDGMVIESNCQLGLGSQGQLQFFLPGSRERLSLSGIVRLAVDEIRLLYAIDFLDLAPQHRAQIRRYLHDERGVSA